MLEDAEVVNLVHRVAVFLGSAEAEGQMGMLEIWGSSIFGDLRGLRCNAGSDLTFLVYLGRLISQ